MTKKKDGNRYLARLILPMKNYYFLLILVVFSIQLNAQKVKHSASGYPTSFHVSRPLRELFEAENTLREDASSYEMEDREKRVAATFRYRAADGPQYGEDPAVRQTSFSINRISNVLANFAGQVGSANPPDPSGVAGPNHYVQVINATRIRVYDKSGNIIGTVTSMGQLWSPGVSNGGDPVVLYDKYADRWVISQLDGNLDNTFHLAVSTSSDPMGTYYTYSYAAPDFPDYPKYSIWADGYYMTSNYLSSDPNVPSLAFAFERDQMIAGNPAARYVTAAFDPGINSGFFIAMPGDADGQLPPFGSPLPIISFYENGWAGGGDSIKIWNMQVDWSASTPTASISSLPALPTAAFDGSYDPNWEDIPQPGTTAMLDGMGGIVQFRAQWRMWTGYNTMVICFPVLISDAPRVRQLRWMELRQDQTSGLWSIYQQSTFAPDDYCRWMGSIAMDDEGNIALCYAKSGPSSLVPNVYPSLAYTGRLASDPLNTMTFAENVVIDGTSIINLTRFGDYSHTSLDPDGLTFWHTGEYVALGKRTRIYAFRLTSAPVGITTAESENSFSASIVNSTLQIEAANLKTNGMMQIDLFDIRGKKLQSAEVNVTDGKLISSFSCDFLPSGTYMVRLGKNNTNFQLVKKVVYSK